MITCHQITYTIPWLLCEHLPYPHEKPQFFCVRQGDKSQMPLLCSTYKYILSRHSFSTSPFSISKTYSLWQRSRRASKHLQLARTHCGKIFGLLASFSSCSEEMAVNINVPEVNPVFIPFYCSSCYSQTYTQYFSFFSSVSLIPQT